MHRRNLVIGIIGLVLGLGCLPGAFGQGFVIISEIMYHPPDDQENTEFIELHNPSGATVDLSGWQFTNGIRYEFPEGTVIEPNGYLVVCKELGAFRSAYGDEATAIGNYDGSLSNGGERVILSDSSQSTVDSVRYRDRSPWPIAPDGYSSSLERICPSAESGPENWAPSPLPTNVPQPMGSPGRQNANYSVESLPGLPEVEFQPQSPQPDQPVKVEAKITDKANMVLLYRVARSGFEGEEMELPMTLASESKKSSRYEAVIPGQPTQTIIRFRIRAVGDNGTVRIYPHPNELRPTYTYFTYANTDPAAILLGFAINIGEEHYEASQLREQERRREMAMEILHSGISLEKAWAFHTFEQDLSASQIHQLREVYRETAGEREQIISDVEESGSVADDIRNLAAQIEELDERLLKDTQPILSQQQYTQFAEWHRLSSRPSPGQGQRWNPAMFLMQAVNLEGAWFFQTMTYDLDEDQLEALRPIYREAAAEREEIIEMMMGMEDDDADEEPGGRESDADRNMVFGRIMGLMNSVTQAASAVLADEKQRQEFLRWSMENSPFGGPPPGAERPEREDEAENGTRRRGDPGRRPRAETAERPGRGGPPGRRPGEGRPGPPAAEDDERTEPPRRFGFGRPVPQSSPPPRGKSAFVVIFPETNNHEIFDYVHIMPRTGGYKVRFHKDQPLNGMTTINLLFEYVPRFALAEHLSYVLYQRAGVPSEHSDYVRLSMDGNMLGYHLLVEQPNRSFLRRHKRDDTGNLYKILWYEEGIVEQHEKKTNLHTGHEDLVSLVSSLYNTEGKEQWQLIQEHFNVEEAINYFAISLCLSNWDGFWNNYLAYHDINGSGKWEIYPWDEDKTWGFYDAARPGEYLHDMPLTFGMDEELAPGQERTPKGGPNWMRPDRPSWWRPAGYFSGQLLANPYFREQLLIRLREIAETIFTEEEFFPIINELEQKLEPEVKLRADANGQNVTFAADMFHDDIESLRKHLTKRRAFMLEQEELRNIVIQ